MPFCLHLVYGCFHVMMAELSYSHRNSRVCKVQAIWVPSCRLGQLTIGHEDDPHAGS